jgi:glycosyltransferase involved in cell wall biosynthesis
MRCGAFVPVRKEEETGADVVAAANASPLVDEVLVVDGRSKDGTRAAAERHGARVVVQEDGGKGEAMALGVRSTDAELIVFLDGDLTGFAPHHVDRLVRSVEAGAIMSCGLFDRGPIRNLLFLHVLPILTGQRCMRRELFESLDADDVRGYRIEAALNCRATELGEPIAAFVCRGMFHRTKEEKYAAPLQGWLAKVSMLATAFSAYGRYLAQRRLGGGTEGSALEGAAGTKARPS